jgi:hypothetical protein
MRSRIEPRLFERVARGLLLSALLVLVWRSWSPRTTANEETVTSGALDAALERWTIGEPPERVSVQLDRVPGVVQRDWLAALRRAGSEVFWSGEFDALALEAVTTAEPQHSYVIRAAGEHGVVITFRDGERELASVKAVGHGASIRTSMLFGPVTAGTGGASALAAKPPAPRVGRVAVIGPAGWETKFVIAALEERGWAVDSRLTVAPGVGVGLLAPGALDTSRYSAAVVVDDVPPGWSADLSRFLGAGGGLVASGAAVRRGSLAALLPARPGRRFASADTIVVDRRALGGTALQPAARAAVLDARGGTPVVSGARFASGRVIVSGYADTWLWRMSGNERSVEAHRDWWSALVGAVAYAVDTADAARSPEAAPLAALHSALGPPVSASRQIGLDTRQLPVEAALFGLAVLALLGETVSRRRRGLA